MRNLDLVDAVVQLHEIAHLVEEEVGQGTLSQSIRKAADRLHKYSIDDDKASKITQEIIKQVKE
jgi:hypothetical protein